MKHIVALSGGKDSTAMALRLAEVEPADYLYVCTPTGRELPAMFAHWRKLGEILGKQIIPITSGKGFLRTSRDHKALPNWRMRFCTGDIEDRALPAVRLRECACRGLRWAAGR